MLRGDSIALTRSGLRPIQECSDEHIVVLDNSSSAKMRKDGKLPTVRLETKNGYTVVCSPDQNILTHLGWKKVSELSSKDRLQLSYSKPFGWETDYFYDTYKNGYAYGLLECTLDISLIKRSSSFIKGYIAGLLCARGNTYYIKTTSEKFPTLRYTSSYNNLTLIQVALASFGVHSNIVHAVDTSWVAITGQSIYLFADLMEEQDSEIMNRLNVILPDMSVNTKLQRDYTYVLTIEESSDDILYHLEPETISGYTANGLIFNG